MSNLTISTDVKKYRITTDKALALAIEKVLHNEIQMGLREVKDYSINHQPGYSDVMIETVQPSDLFWIGYYAAEHLK